MNPVDWRFLFADRHCGVSADDQAQMLAALGLRDLEDMARALPDDILAAAEGMGEPLTEREAFSVLYGYARENKPAASMIGLGYYGVDMPSVIRRKLMEDPAWYTAYTPYQPEISQGRLEMLLNFQSMVSDLTALPMAVASLLDEATAAAEAMVLFWRENKSERHVFLADELLFPQTLALLHTRAEPLGIEVVVAAADSFAARDDAFGVLLAYPGANGAVRDFSDIIATLKQNDVFVACATDLLALTLLTPPGEMGADVAIGSAQRFGMPLGGGGPHPGFMTFREKFRMRVPGRIVGVSKDVKGRVGYRLSLQTREQHIRREKATSNICTAQALPAMITAAYAIYHGPRQIKNIALRVQALTEILVAGLRQMRRPPQCDSYFGTVRVVCADSADVVARAGKAGINLYDAGDGVGISVDEITESRHIEKVWRAFGDNAPAFADVVGENGLPSSLARTTAYLAHPVFNSHHTEQQMLRYLRHLAEKDVALNRSMIPLGSCTMKLNATTEMEPLSWPQFANVHPFAPPQQFNGYQRLLEDFARLLAQLTGFAAVSLQPNAGAQGEYAGLLTIRKYLRDKGERQRHICLIPQSAHGTNPASAVMAGMKVVVLKVDDVGQVAVDDLRAKIEEHGDSIAALMLTYPSTCGVFGTGLREICDMVHAAGAQVYMDGANLNALVGVSLPGKLGPDVMHINLHKTFCIPHGGGGPGMGPIAVSAHLAPYLPGHPLAESPASHCGTVSAAPYGSPLILVISWMYIRMMGAAGLRRATLTALLNANYMVKRLEEDYSFFFRGAGGYVAHECIVDTNVFKKSANITVEDIAKRLMDFGFHAPTVSWPVAGAMMIEPTESESKDELDRYCDALLQIRREIAMVEKGDLPKDDNPLINAPHTAEDVVATDWKHAYSRETAVYPMAWVRRDKYWPPVGRIDAVYGDRNLVCVCPPLEDYE